MNPSNIQIYIFISIILLVLFYLKDRIILYKSKIIDSRSPIKKLVFIGGQHGNEPSGTIALEQMHGYFKSWVKTHTNLEIIVVPRLNYIGLLLGTRNTLNPICPDSNRCWEKKSSIRIINRLLPLIKDASIVLDFHEGYDVYKHNKSSLGSTISGATTGTIETLGKEIAAQIGFSYIDRLPCDTKGTLNCYCEKNNIPFFLVETTRGPQWPSKPMFPMKVRVDQVKEIIKTVLSAKLD